MPRRRLFDRRPRSGRESTGFQWGPAANARPAEAAGWVRRAYGERAAELIADLAKTMRAAEAEAKVPRTRELSGEPAGTARQTLHDDLFELRTVMIAAVVSEADRDRDVHLRAALSEAIGAASSLASVSHDSPTGGYVGVVRPAIDGVLIAAGEPIV